MKKAVLALIAVLAMAALLPAQGGTATLSGTVTDPGGAVLQKAKVTAVHVATGLTRTVETSETGTYFMPNLPVGAYDVTVESNGFTTAKTAGVTITVGQVATLNFKLDVGSVSQSVEVNAEAVAPVELDSSQVSNVVDNRRIENMPLITRDPYSLVLLSPGTSSTTSYTGGFSVNGSRDRNNNFMLDGVDNNDTSVPGGASGITSLSPEATQEFRVITNNFMPEYGRNTGAIVDIVTKSGTNELHGEAHWFGRYDRFGARDWFNRKVDTLGEAVEKDPYTRNTFGYSVGGPVRKNRTFFFFNNEFFRYRTALSNTAYVPTAAFKTGVFEYEGHQVDLTNPENNPFGLAMSPMIQRVLALYPEPNAGTLTSIHGLYTFPTKSRQDVMSLAGKIDHRFTDRHNFNVRYTFNDFKDPNAGQSDFLPGLDSYDLKSRTHNIAGNLTSVLSNSLVNELRAGFNRNDANFTCTGIDVMDPLTGGRDLTLPEFSGFGCFTLDNSPGQQRRTGTYTLADSMSWVKGSHNIKFGGDYRFIFENGDSNFLSRENLTFNLASAWGMEVVEGAGPELNDALWMLLGAVDTQFQSQFFDATGNRTPSDFRKFRQREISAFFQDSWKVTPRFTLNYGIRYQFNGVPYEVNGNLSNFFGDPGSIVNVDTDNDGVPDSFEFTLVGKENQPSLYTNDYTMIQPRIGFAWDPFGKGSTSLRGSFGIFHDRMFGNMFNNARGNPPFQQDQFAIPMTLDGKGNIVDVLPVDAMDNLPNATPSLYVADGSMLLPVFLDPNIRMPRSMNWSFGFQHELFNNATLEVNYVGTHQSNLMRNTEANPPRPEKVAELLAEGFEHRELQSRALWTLGATNNTAFGRGASMLRSIGRSNYNALQTTFTKRMSHGFQVQAAYTWAHALDDASDPLAPAAGNSGFPRNSFRLDREYGNSDMDVRHRLVTNYILDLPFGTKRAFANSGVLGKVLEGFSLSGITSWQTGSPFDIFSRRDSQHAGRVDRAYLNGDAFEGVEEIEEAMLDFTAGINPAAFSDPAWGTASNLSRNQFYGPHYFNTDLVLGKVTGLTERVKLNLRFEMFNVFNTPHFAQPNNTIGAGFGKSTATRRNGDGTSSNRQFQFGAKLEF